MEEHSSSTKHKKRRAALSKELLGPYENLFAGHIDWKLDHKNNKIGGKRLTDIYYTRRI